MRLDENSVVNAMKKTLWRFFRSLPIQNTIIFESNPDYACNTFPVFLQLRKDLPGYRMVWCTSSYTGKIVGVDDVFLNDTKNFFEWLKGMYYRYTAKALVSCNRTQLKTRKEQISLYLCHGSKTKKTRGNTEINKGVDHINVQSYFFDDIITYEYNCPAEKLVYLGYPRCDWLFDKPNVIVSNAMKLCLPEKRYAVWLPTYRKHKHTAAANQMNVSKYNGIGMPLVYTEEGLCRLNDFLTEIGFCILYKPHPAQDVTALKAASLSHICVIHDQNLQDMGLQLYQVLAGSDALITDYSSVYFDYLLLDKPIATTTDDIDDWKKMTGFAFDLDAFYDCSTARAATLDELMRFLSDVVDGKDGKQEGRKEIREKTNMYFDGNSAKRVADFILEKIGETK